jgi:phage gp45-like
MKTKTQYRVRHWATYNRALVNRGNLTLWVDEEALQAWQYTGPTQRGAQDVYAEAAIQCGFTLRAV